MGWNELDQGGGGKQPVLNARDCKTPTRIRLIAGPGRYAEPEQIWQHWGPENSKMPPVICIGERDGCIFHQEPLNWRLGKTNVMNAVLYTANTGGGYDAKIVVLQSPATLLTQIRDQSRNVNVDPTTVDWIISKSGTGKEGTKYNAVLAPGAPIHGATLDLSQWPLQEPEFAYEALPQLVDYDKIEGFEPMTPEQQGKWLDEVTANVQKRAAKDAQQSGGTPPAPAAAPSAGSPPPVAPPPPAAAAPPAPVTPPPAAAAPPPAAGLPTMPPAAATPPATPPPAPAPAPAAPDPTEAAKALPDPWGRGTTMGALPQSDLQFIVANEASFAAFPAHVTAAKLLLGAAPAPAAAPVPAPVAPAAPGGDQAALKTQMEQLMQSMAVFQDFQNAKAFFTKVVGKSSLKQMDATELAKMIAIAQQGDDAVRRAIA